MKTTIDLPDDLLIAAKQVAASRQTTLKEMITRSLRREIGLTSSPPTSPLSVVEMSEYGLPRLKRRGAVITSEMVYKMMEDEDV